MLLLFECDTVGAHTYDLPVDTRTMQRQDMQGGGNVYNWPVGAAVYQTVGMRRP